MPDAFDRQIVQRLSMSRLTGYLRVSSNDISLALRLYEWNTQMSAAFFELLSDVEVVVRNSFHEQLTVWHGVQNGTDQWYDNRHGFLQPRATAAIQEARTRIANKGKSATSDQIISELGFGFWRFLLTKPYKTTLWPFAGQYAFPNVSSTDQFFSRIARLHDFRNRIAHHEPIHMRQLDLDLLDCFQAVGAVCRETESWVRKRSRVESLLQLRQSTLGI
jgi:hypothetical protein